MTTEYNKDKVHDDLAAAGTATYTALELVMKDLAFGLSQFSENEMMSLVNAQIQLNKAVRDIRGVINSLINKEDKSHA